MKRASSRLALALAATFVFSHLPLSGAESTGTPEAVSFHRQIRPLLQARCAGCHQPAKDKGGYVVTEFSRLLTAGDSGEPPVLPGNPDGSHLVAQITPVDGKAEMPRNEEPLGEAEIDLIRRWIAEGARDDTPPSRIRAFDPANPPRYSSPPVITSLDYSPDGRWIAVAGFHEVLLHHADGSGIAARLIGLAERIQSVRFSPDGRWLAVAGGLPARMGEIQVWDVERRELRTSVTVGHDTVYGVHWSPDGRIVSFGCSDKTVRAIEAASGRQVLQQMAHEDWVLDTVFSADGSHVISVGRDMTAKLTEVPTQRFIDNITSITPGALRGGLQSVARHPVRDEILVGGADGQPQIYRIFRQVARKIGDNANLLRRFPEIEGRIFGVDYSPDGGRIAAAAGLDDRGTIQIYAAEFDPTIPETVLNAYRKTSGEYTREEREAIEAFVTADVRLLHKFESPTAAVYSVAFSPDGRTIAAGTSRGVVLLLNAETGELRSVFAAAPLEDEPPAQPIVIARRAPIADERKAFESLPPGTRVTGLTVSPATIRFTSRNDQVQLVVTATLASGDSVDVTRIARYELPETTGYRLRATPGGLLSVDPDPAASPSQAIPDRRTLRLHLGELLAEVPVEIDLPSALFEADFIHDVNPVLAKLGCSAGTCHGAREGKNGFKLSLRGYDPVFDVRSITDDLAARRVNFASPDESLVLLKATATVPHEGGQRTTPDSREYAILRQWIANGARLSLDTPRVTRIEILPENPVVQAIGARQQMRVVATYADGERRDVTAEAFIESGNSEVAQVDSTGLVSTLRRGEAPLLARFEGSYAATTVTVMGDRTGFVWADPPIHNRIDELVAAKWRRMKLLPSDLCSDAEFVRRVYLDLTGLPPSPDEVRDFLANPRDRRSKRDALIERLLHSDAYVDHWANKWADLLQVNRKFLGVEGARIFRDWIRRQIQDDVPYDRMVRQLLSASGSNRENPAASYWKILREPTEAMENTTHLFLATRFNCNKCHDHPFERWTQDQYYELAQFFAQVKFSRDEASGNRRVGGSAVEGARPLFEIVSDAGEGSVIHDRTGQPVEPAFPFPAGPAEPDPNATRRGRLAEWITAPDNPYFALSYVNRLWGYLMGVGLIEPLDDIRAGNPPSNPELLEHLTREFIESGFNTRHILRQICQSRTYQLSIETHQWNEDDTVNYSHALARRLPAEVLLDSVYRVTGATPRFPDGAEGIRAAQLIDSAVDLPGGFLATLGRPPRESACECERSNDIKLSSVMSLLSGPAVAQAIQDPENALVRIADSVTDPREITEALYLRILNRPPRASEVDAFSQFMRSLEDEHARLEKAVGAAEAEWAARRPGLERRRLDEITRAERELAAHLLERAPAVAAAQRERLERIALAEAAVAELEPALRSRAAELARSGDAGPGPRWIPLEPKDLRVSGSASLEKRPDGSIRSTASGGELPRYVVTAETALSGITGVRLEVLPDASLPGFGPGHREGDFLLSEFIVESASLTNAETFTRVKLTDAAADVTAPGMDLRHTFDGIIEQGRREGWSIGGDAAARPHWAAFAFENPVGDTNGTVLRFSLVHAYEAPHEIGRFRLWITTNSAPTEPGLPAAVAEILDLPPRKRTEAHVERLLSHIRSGDPEALRRGFELELAQRPLPEDPRLRELERNLERASRPVPVDPALLQLREDLELSARQLESRRLTAAQDLAWALINTPAFLFNH